MTDNDIMKALECCTNCICNHAKTDTECPLVKMSFCKNYLMKESLSLINRLKKYDEERDIRLHARLSATAKEEGIKEFAERLKRYATSICSGHGMSSDVVYVGYINEVVKEMTGEKT